MLLTQPRVALLHLCLAAMQAAWITPFVLLFYDPAPGPWPTYAAVLALLLAWMLALELLSRKLDSPAYDTAGLGLMVLTSLLALRLILYPGGRPWDLSWLLRAVADALNFKGGFPPALVLVAGNLFLWQRATSATSRDLTFFGVGVSFRLGMLLLILGGGVYAVVRGPELLSFLWAYFAVGLLAVSISRIGEKAVEAQSAGTILPVGRLAQVMGAVGVTMGVVVLAGAAYTPEGVRRFFHLFAPLGELLKPVLIAIIFFLGRLLEPFLLWLEQVIVRMLQRTGAPAIPETGTLATPGQTGNPNLPAWPLELLRSATFVVIAVCAAAGVVIFLLLYLERVRRETRRVEAEDENRLSPSFGGGILGRGLASLREAIRLARRFGMGRELLAAISVQNIYANLSRIARRHGLARAPSQPPDDYLPVLARIFPGEEPALSRITTAYMRVHYGDRPVGIDELAALRDDYRSVRAAEVAE